MVRLTVVALALALVACQAPTPTNVGDPTPPASPTPSPSASPKKKPPPPPPRARYAIYVVDGKIWFYDVRTDTVADVASGTNVRLPRWVSRNEVSFLQDASDGFGSPTTLRLLNLRTGDLQDVFTIDEGIRTYAWSPDHQVVAYVTIRTHDYPQVHFRTVIGSGGTRTVATLARIQGRERTDHDQERIEWSRDGSHALIVYTPADGEPDRDASPEESQLQVRTFDGALAFAADHEADPTMGFWSPAGARAYFRTSTARFWSSRDRSVHGLASAPVWFAPSQSPDGNVIAYDTGQSSAGVRVEVYDVRSGARRAITGSNRGRPVFATTKIVWVQVFRRCANVCLGETEPVSQVYAVNLATQEVRELAIRSLGDVDVYFVRPKRR